MLYILKISLVTYIFKLNSLKSATKANNLASFKEIQWQIILVWNVGLYLKECKISSKNVLFLPWKNCRQLNLLTISPRKKVFPYKHYLCLFYFHLLAPLLSMEVWPHLCYLVIPINACTLRITAAAGTELAGASSKVNVKANGY